MKKLVFLILCACMNLHLLHAQLAIGEWQTHMAYAYTSESVFFGGKVYGVSNGSLYSYDPEDGDILTYDIIYPLSDVEITHMAVCPSQKKLVLVYSNGNIDLMDEQGEVYNITDLKNSPLPDKSVSGICIDGDRAYLPTGTSIVVVDVKKREIAITYTLGHKVQSCAVHGNWLLAATSDDGLYRGRLTDNLLDLSKWSRISADTFTHLITHKGVLYGNILGKALLRLNPETGESVKVLDGTYNYFFQVNERLAAGRANSKLYLFESPEAYEVVTLPAGVVDISYGKSTFWVSSSQENLSGYTLDGDALKQSVSPLSLNAPQRNLFYQMFMHQGSLYTCGGGIYWDRYHNPGTIQVLEEGGLWHVYQEEGIPAKTGKSFYRDITSLAVDPDDANHLFASSAGEGLYEFQNGEFVTLHTPDNSGVSSDYRYPHIIRVNGLCYDNEKNLWMLCAGATDIISIYTADKKWMTLHHEEISQLSTFRGTFFDRRGWMWCLTPDWHETGIFVLDYNGTLENTADDRTVYIHDFKNQDGTAYSDYYFTCAVEDNDGAIWVGTESGLFVISDPTTVFDADNFFFTQVKVPRNDGTNYADYLLHKASITAIAVDGANRKWIGTSDNGLYLVSADGLEEIHHFTTENSPLLSDEIQSIAVNSATGLVYIGTSKGLVAYQSEATEAQSDFSESRVRAYPNPVRPDYQGYIQITGLMMNSQVKITDSYGSLVYEGVSVGGSFSWNGRNTKGERVSSGVYHVMATDEEGQEGIVTKIVMVK